MWTVSEHPEHCAVYCTQYIQHIRMQSTCSRMLYSTEHVTYHLHPRSLTWKSLAWFQAQQLDTFRQLQTPHWWEWRAQSQPWVSLQRWCSQASGRWTELFVLAIHVTWGHSMRPQREDTAWGHSVRTQREDTAWGHSVRTQREDTEWGHSVRTQREDTACGKSVW
jgi:hypothetical protein